MREKNTQCLSHGNQFLSWSKISFDLIHLFHTSLPPICFTFNIIETKWNFPEVGILLGQYEQIKPSCASCEVKQD